MIVYEVVSKLKKYGHINGYQFQAHTLYSALKHVARRLRLSDYDINKLFKNKNIILKKPCFILNKVYNSNEDKGVSE